MPLAMSVVWEVIKENNKSKQYAELLRKFDEVLGLEINKKVEIELPEEVKKLVEERKLARLNKDWAKSDELRDKIDQMGYSVKDTKDGMEITK